MAEEKKMIAKKDLKDQLQRLHNLARHNFVNTNSDVDRTYQKGQMNAIKAVGVSYGIEVF